MGVGFFGRITSAAKVASYTAEARKADVAAVKLSLSAEVATAYFNAIAAHKKLSLLEERLKNSQKLLSLQNMRLDEGLGTSLDMLQQKKLVSEVAQLIPAAKADVRLYENRLDVLLGEMPDGKNRVSSKSSLDFAKNLPSLGVPSDLLASRPDLLAIKAELVSADAGVAEAIASRMPRITLTGSHAFADGSSFTRPLSLLTATFVQPLIDWGKKRAEVERNQYIYKEKLAQYTQQYLQAVEDVEAAIYQERRQRETVEEVLEQKTVMRRVLKGAKARYTQGVDDYIPSLTALEEMSKIKISAGSEAGSYKLSCAAI